MCLIFLEVEGEEKIEVASKVIGIMRAEVMERRKLRKEQRRATSTTHAVAGAWLQHIHGCETLLIQNQYESRLQAKKMQYVRKVEGVMRINMVGTYNSNIMQKKLNQKQW